MISKLRFKFYWRYREFSERLHLFYGKEFILVYTMGKVGSTSIYYALKKVFGPKVLFIHFLQEKNIKIYNRAFEKAGIKAHRLVLGPFVNKKLIAKEKKTIIISSIREPIARNISSFFEDFRVYNEGKWIDEISETEAIENFINNYPHHSPAHWFKEEFLYSLNLEMKDVQFNITEKAGEFEHHQYKVLLFRTDLEDDKKVDLLKTTLNQNNIEIKTKNAHFQKSYRTFYQNFKAQIKLDELLIEDIYSAEYLRLFYSPTEINAFKLKWK